MTTKQISALVALTGITGIAAAVQVGTQDQQTQATTTTTSTSSVPVSITVPAGARQRFAGLGTSVGNWRSTYQKLTAAERASLSQMLWRDLKFNTLRLWMNTDEYAPTRGAHDLSTFRRMYVESGIIADARKHGVTTLLLGPDKLPPHMREGKNIKDAEVENYAVLLADFIERLKEEDGITLHATGVQNEPNNANNGPGMFTPEQMVRAVKRLRTELDKRNLQEVKIIASETASADDTHYKFMDALKADVAAWKALDGVSSHSYNMAATDKAASYAAGADGSNAKEYWMTEASDNGPEEPGDAFRAMTLAARFLNDMNHRVTHWIHFLGFEQTDPKDNATRIIAYTPNPLNTTVYLKYFVYQQLANAFDVGARFRDSQSTLDGDMTWTYGKKPRVIASTAQNPDGSWAIGITNHTADSFAGIKGWSDDKWNIEQGGHTPGQTFAVTVRVDELKNRAAVPFVVHRTSANLKNARGETVTMRNGEVQINVAPLELVTLRSAATNKQANP
jgi:O-glycosyl hydrolase